MTLCEYCAGLVKHEDEHPGQCCDCFDRGCGMSIDRLFDEGRWPTTLARNLYLAAGLCAAHEQGADEMRDRWRSSGCK